MLKRIKHLLPFDARVKRVLPLMRENSSSGETDVTMLDLTALQNKATKGKLPLTGLTMRHLQCTDALKGAGARVVNGKSYDPS